MPRKRLHGVSAETRACTLYRDNVRVRPEAPRRSFRPEARGARRASAPRRASANPARCAGSWVCKREGGWAVLPPLSISQVCARLGGKRCSVGVRVSVSVSNCPPTPPLFPPPPAPYLIRKLTHTHITCTQTGTHTCAGRPSTCGPTRRWPGWSARAFRSCTPGDPPRAASCPRSGSRLWPSPGPDLK